MIYGVTKTINIYYMNQFFLSISSTLLDLQSAHPKAFS